ncbi:MAG: hypothetical protein RL660_1306 [Bacteroidota bacterium]|jgi:uncharacterized protein YbbC (DUF1343 family)
MKFRIGILGILCIAALSAFAIRVRVAPEPAANATAKYLPQLEGKNVALVVNHTSMIKSVHLVDMLVENGVTVSKIFAPEHGFRGKADAGEHLANGIDKETGISVVSLYGDNKKPTKAHLTGVDVVVFDIQDVGVRFYTYISTLQYVMEACAENKVTLIVLDRPNPNGDYIDGPVLDMKHKSFVGMQAVPIVYGMTIGEYALMLNGEGLLANKVKCKLTVLPCTNYTHKSKYILPIAPSPNLKSAQSIMLYPSLCLFEGTEVSVGRGTDKPFMMWGHPSYKNNGFSFTPVAGESNKNPMYKDKKCYGANLDLPPYEIEKIVNKQLNLEFLRNAYKLSPNKAKFFVPFFTKLAGTTTLQQQIVAGKTDEQIRASWKPGIDKFKKVREKYLLYPDFE